MTNQLSEAQANQLVFFFNCIIKEGRIPTLLFTLAYAQQAVLERTAETGRDDHTSALSVGFDDLLKLVSVPMSKV